MTFNSEFALTVLDSISVTNGEAMARSFGGSWTREKLNIIERYFVAYLKVMKNQSFLLEYIDAFAGAGSIELASTDERSRLDVSSLIDGSVRRVLGLDPGFHHHLLIEKDSTAVKSLHQLSSDFPDKDVNIVQGDGNEELQRHCRSSRWKNRRAVVFLDPTGMQVDWSTMIAIAKTESIDVWIWFPLGVGVNRLLTKSGEIPSAWQNSLDRIFGTASWRERFYQKTQDLTLFGIEESITKIASTLRIAEFYNERLSSVFPAVAPKPLMMRNSTNNPIYLLCFASANPGRGGKHAVRIARHLLESRA